jgi:hypothetical protein
MQTTSKKSGSRFKKTLKKDDFFSVARRLECDEDKARFEKKLGKIASVKIESPRSRAAKLK